jgi:1,4-dihydroxy-2-naphthoate polyprenyltransferase
LFVLIFFGFVPVAGTYYVMALKINSQVLLAGLAPGLLSIGILAVNNLRDLNTDRVSGKRTLAVRFGKRFAQIEYVVVVVAATLSPLLHYLIFRKHPFTMLASVTLLLTFPLCKTVLTVDDGKVLNNTLASTGRLLLLFGICFSVGLLL